MSQQAKAKMQIDKAYILRLAGTLLGITVVTALLLGLVNMITEPRIEAANAEKTRLAMSQVLTAEEYLPVETDAEGVTALYEARSGGSTVGYVAEVAPNGFKGPIQMVVGVDLSGCVTGVSVTDNEETQGVGTKVVGNQEVLDQFIGMSGTITVGGGGENAFDAVTGATVSYRGVTAGVNTALAAVAPYIAEEG